MDELLSGIRRHVAQMVGQVGTTRLGVVTSVNVQNYTAKVTIQPDGVLTGWLPIAASMVGSGWGLVSPPSPGEQVAVLAQEGDNEHGIIVGRIFSNPQQPPVTYTDQYNQSATTNVQPGEIGLVHQSGTFLRLIAGAVLINGNLWVNGTIHSTGNITSDAEVFDARGTVDTLRKAYNVHVHGTSPPTNLPVPDTALPLPT